MIANVSAHRRANAFAQALEDQSDQDPAAQQPEEAAAGEESGLLSLAAALGELPKPELDPEVRVTQRAQLVAAMEAMVQEGGAGASVPKQRQGKGAHRASSPLRKLKPRSRLTKGIAASGLTVGVAAGAFGGVAAASSNALPGDHLYGLKRGMEDLKLGMANSDSDKGRAYLDQASTRLSEARRLMERGRSGQLDHESVGEVRRALSGVRYDASEGHRLLSDAYKRDGALGPIQALSAFSDAHRESWSALSDRLPVQLGDVRDQVSSVFDAIDEEVGPLRSLLPQTPDQKGAETSPGSSQDGTSPETPGTGRSTPSGPSGHDDATSTKPKPSTSDSGKDQEGLLGENTGGLLDPPKDRTSPSTSDDTPSSGTGTGGTPKPDVTVPPLLPGLLPGLGIDGEDAK